MWINGFRVIGEQNRGKNKKSNQLDTNSFYWCEGAKLLYTEKLKTTIGGSIKYNIYEFIEFEKWDQENCEAHPKVLL